MDILCDDICEHDSKLNSKYTGEYKKSLSVTDKKWSEERKKQYQGTNTTASTG